MVMISAKISAEDKNFLKDNEIGITELIRTAIYQRKVEINGGSPNFEEERRKREVFQKKFSKAVSFMEEQGVLDKWITLDVQPPEIQQ